jgi:cytochrome b subunit of formate dehydrogenase
MGGEKTANAVATSDGSSLVRVAPGVARDATVARHCTTVRLVHWSVALSTLALLLSGMFQLPIAKRYFIDQLPGLGWSANFGASLVVHYLAAALLVFGATLHMVYHGVRGDRAIVPRRGDVRESVQIVKAMLGLCEEPRSHKYLAEQRLAYAYIAASLALVIATGAVKVVKNLPGADLPAAVVNVSTHLHNLGMVLVLLGVAAHLLAFLVPANRELLPSMFTGRVRTEYARRRHRDWLDELRREGATDDDRPRS